MRSSGTTAITTSGDSAVTVLAATVNLDREITVINSGTEPGFVSIDGGNTWQYLPAGDGTTPGGRTFDIRHRPSGAAVKVKRIPSGTDLGGIYADGF